MASTAPNILIIWGDEIGWFNISAYNHGIMGYRTPNIDRIAREGALFTDWYGQQSCTAAHAAFITGQSPIRTGLTEAGEYAEKPGLQAEDPTIAELLKPLGYVCGQFGNHHLGDGDESLPTAHGFDEFFGNLCRVSAKDEPGSEFERMFGSRGVLHSWANPDGEQTIEDTGPLNRKRSETVEGEITSRALDFIERQARAGKPFFCWWNSARTHAWTSRRQPTQSKTGLGLYPDAMVEHDGHVGRLLAKLDELGIADNTIVMYSTDNGAQELNWPDSGTTPFRGQKATNWDGGWRVPAAIRWPGVIEPGTVCNEVFSHQDMLPTLLAAAGERDIVERCKKGHTAGRKTFRVHLDGFNLMPYLVGEVKKSPRPGFLYWSDAGDLVALRYDSWKVHFAVQYSEGFEAWQEPLEKLTSPMLVNLRADPFENAEVASDHAYDRWRAAWATALEPVGALVEQCIETLKDFPPRQSPESWGPGAVIEKLRRHQELLGAGLGERHVAAG